MKLGGKALGIAVILITLALIVVGFDYSNTLDQRRADAIERLQSLPPERGCAYEDPSLCPQAEDHLPVPNATGIGLVLLGILLGIYLFQSDSTQKKILEELSSKRQQLANDERKELILSVLTNDERKVVSAVAKQQGISQATLRLRTGFSKPKLSNLLKELESREIIAKEKKGKSNSVYIKRGW